MAALVAASSMRYGQHFQKVFGLTARLAWIFFTIGFMQNNWIFFGMMDSMRVLKDGNHFTWGLRKKLFGQII